MILRIFSLSIAFLLFLGSISMIWAGGGEDSVDMNRKTPRILVKKGKILFVHYCAHCHGLSGDGDGFNAEFLDKEPAELSDQKFQAKKTNHQIYKVINKGGASVRKSHLMPVFGKTLSEAEIWALVAYVRDLGGDDSHPVFLPQSVNEDRPLDEPVSKNDLQSFSQWFKDEGGNESSIQAGEKLFKKKKSCFACHQLEEDGEESGGRIGPDLSQAGVRYGPEWLYAWIKNPHAYKRETKMPNMAVSTEEAQVLSAFLSGLGSKNQENLENWQPFLNATGNSETGKSLFFDPEGKVYCSKCHRVDGKGGTIGPDLSFVGTSRSRLFLLESILDPKAVITAGYSTVLILTKERKFITGVLKFEDDSGVNIVDKEGNDLFVSKEQIKKYKTQKISMMPGNFKDLMEAQEVADILAYLTSLKRAEFSGLSGGEK
jgi:putative heme-binding domain-containing protein